MCLLILSMMMLLYIPTMFVILHPFLSWDDAGDVKKLSCPFSCKKVDGELLTTLIFFYSFSGKCSSTKVSWLTLTLQDFGVCMWTCTYYEHLSVSYLQIFYFWFLIAHGFSITTFKSISRYNDFFWTLDIHDFFQIGIGVYFFLCFTYMLFMIDDYMCCIF